MYIDEAGVENTLDYPYAYSPKGQAVVAERLGHFTERVSMIAAWCLGNVFAPMTFSGHCGGVLVETWFDRVLLPKLRPGQTVVLGPSVARTPRNNASFHRQAKLEALLKPLGCHLLPLPPTHPTSIRLNTSGTASTHLFATIMTPPSPFRPKSTLPSVVSSG